MTLIETRRRSATLNLRAGHSVSSAIIRMYDIWRQRQVLRNLDAHALEDIGVTRKQAQDEARRPVWDAPATWRC